MKQISAEKVDHGDGPFAAAIAMMQSFLVLRWFNPFIRVTDALQKSSRTQEGVAYG